MISDDALKRFANKYQTTELNVRREYFQHLFLSHFYQQPQTDKIYFKGGTALRILYNSPRFSEDLDFSSSLRDIRPIEHAVLGTLEAIEPENIATDIKESKKTSGGYLAIISFPLRDGTTAIQLDISLRQGEKKGEVVTITLDYLPAFTVVALEQRQLVNEKIQAPLSRTKARDFYDLYFVLRANLLSSKDKDFLSQTYKILKKSQINFERELKEFLPKSHWATIRSFPLTLEREIKRFL